MLDLLGWRRRREIYSAVLGCGVLLAVTLACGGGGHVDSQCTLPTQPGTHTILVTQYGDAGCTVKCASGWYDCDDNADNGCESTTRCPPPSDGGFVEGGTKTATLLGSLTGAPHGIAVCGSQVFYLEGMTLASPGKVVAALPSTPAGGLTCDGTDLYFATAADGDAGANGSLWRFHIGDAAPTQVLTGIDPGRGIDARAGVVYWLARASAQSDAGAMLMATGDAGANAIAPASETSAYKSFTATWSGEYTLAGGAAWQAAADGGATPFPLDASAATSLFESAQTYPYVVVSVGGVDAGDNIFSAPGAFIAGPTPRVVASASNGKVAVLASDDALYVMDLQTNKITLLSKPYLHVTDVAVDAQNAYWLARGQGSALGSVWKVPLP